MFKPSLDQQKIIQKKGGQGTFKHMIYLPLPFYRNVFGPKKAVYDLPVFDQKKR